jgi:hypothetical protein
MQNVVNNKVDAVITLSSGICADIQVASQDISSLRTDFSTVEGDLRMLRSTLDPGLQAIMQRIDHLSGQVAMMRVSPATSGTILQSAVRVSSSLVVELHLTDRKNQQACTIQQQLIAKPSLFHQFCVEAQRPNITTNPNLFFQDASSSACKCRYLNRHHKPGKQILSFEYTLDTDHGEHCPFHVGAIKQRRLQFKFSYCSLLISRSLRVVAGFTSGAGGNSLCAQIDWIPMVSSETSPAMQLVLRLRRQIIAGLEEETTATVLENGRLDLLKLVAEGKAHPREFDEEGRTLLEVWTISATPALADPDYSMSFVFRGPWKGREVSKRFAHSPHPQVDELHFLPVPIWFRAVHGHEVLLIRRLMLGAANQATEVFGRFLYSLASLGAKAPVTSFIR